MKKAAKLPKRQPIKLMGDDFTDSANEQAEPGSTVRDYYLAWATLAAGKAKATHLRKAEMRGIAWFAHLPEMVERTSETSVATHGLEDAYFDETNFYSMAFFNAWVRDPEATFRLLRGIRRHMKNPRKRETVERIRLVGSSIYSLTKNDSDLRKKMRPSDNVLEALRRQREWGLVPSGKISKPRAAR